MTEAQVTRKVNKYLKDLKQSLGSSLFYQKISDRFTDGIPDLYIAYRGESLWLELKATGERPRKLQDFVLTRLKNSGVRAEWADSFEGAKFHIDKLLDL